MHDNQEQPQLHREMVNEDDGCRMGAGWVQDGCRMGAGWVQDGCRVVAVKLILVK